MPRITESDDEEEYHGSGGRIADSSSESDDYQHPRKAAVHAYQYSRSSAPYMDGAPRATVTKVAVAPKRRIVEEDDNESPFVPSHVSHPPTTASSAPKPPSSVHMITIASKPPPVPVNDHVLLSDDEFMDAPSAKRRKLPPPNKSSATTKKQPKNGSDKKVEKRFYSDDDDSDVGDSDDVLSDDYDEDSFVDDEKESLDGMVAEEDDDEEFGSTRKPKARASSKASNKPRPSKSSKSGGRMQKGSSSKGSNGASGGGGVSKSSAQPKSSRVDLAEADDASIVVVDSSGDVSSSDVEFSDVEFVGVRRTRAPLKKTLRQRALLGEHESEHLALTGTRNVPTAVVLDPRKEALLARKPTLTPKKVERTYPPDDVMQEVTQIVTQLLHRSTFDRVETKRDIRNEPMFNPEHIKVWSKPEGEFLTIPLGNYPTLFPPVAGWSSQPLRQTDTVSISTIHVNRNIRDCP